ncbi:AraC family transcriptional regulator [Acinetobacter sp. ANC 4648]|uniref:AraC family transcriptional regulator n=1 Tax=Acinetobacter sp. ANC 4648 TaxID=1977875 RepID=UPI000A345C4A|nr:AraC family transcriptional regulator [Acinetobacter sp. ANC 4648]OTG85121.1 AraC family transcriptional regulator [Acinetobacter sp. ANC 4648]
MQTPLPLLNTLIEIEEFHYHKNDIVTPHSSLWGDFNFSFNGLLEFSINHQLFLSPPSYGFWIPPQTEHCSVAVDEHITHYICIRIHPELCNKFASTCKTFSISPFFRHTVAELLAQKKLNYPSVEYQQHLLQVLLDQMQFAPCYDQYLPQSNHPILEPILKKLADPLLFTQSLQQIFESFNFSERHILRLSQQELQISISEWRNRAKLIYVFSQLKQGQSIKRIAYELGYQHSSSFIEFFKRYTGQTPSQMREA